MDLQKTWDACLIRCWRLDLTLWDVFDMFGSMTKQEPADLLRMPRVNMPRKIRVRVFMDQYLRKISDRLWAQKPEKDIDLLRKLQTSKYDTVASHSTNATNDLQSAMRSVRKNSSKIKLASWKYGDRNHATDWNTHQ